MKLQNKIVIVTGGSRGIGYATVEKFLREGATVILTASTAENAQKAVNKLKAQNPDAPVYGISPELTILDSVKEAFGKIVDQFGRIDILWDKWQTRRANRKKAKK